MQFKVPQFIDIEDKVIGPLTLKQFLFFLAGLGILGIVWYLFKFAAFLIIAIPVVGLSIALAFYKYNERPLITILSSAMAYFLKPKLYIWKHKK